MKIVVAGSINMDIVNEVAHHPRAGETIHGQDTAYHPGGKGANQAVAAAKSGADVAFIGAVGEDAFGQELISALQSAGVDTNRVTVKAGTSGLAFITVAGDGENTIILSKGANGELLPIDIDRCKEMLQSADVLLTQNEIPWETTCRAIELAHAAGVRVFLNPAPARPIDAHVLKMVDVLVLNETETEAVTGIHVDTVEDARAAAAALLVQGVKQVVITLGTRGAVDVAEDMSLHVPAFSVKAIDTTAAGDTFLGALASQDLTDVRQAIRYASAASAIAVTREGAQPSIPTGAEVVDFLRDRA